MVDEREATTYESSPQGNDDSTSVRSSHSESYEAFQPIPKGGVYRLGLVGLAVALLVFGMVFVLRSTERKSFPPLNGAAYLGAATLLSDTEKLHADFLLFNGTTTDSLILVPLVSGSTQYSVTRPDMGNEPLVAPLTFRTGQTSNELTFWGTELDSDSGNYQGQLAGEKGESGAWTLHPIRSLTTTGSERSVELARLRMELEKVEHELTRLRREKQRLEEDRVALDEKREVEKTAEAEQVEEQTEVSLAEREMTLSTLERQEVSLLNDIARRMKYSDRGRAVELAHDSLDRELRWFEAKLSRPKKPTFLDPEEEEYFQRAQRSALLEQQIRQEEQNIAALLVKQSPRERN